MSITLDSITLPDLLLDQEFSKSKVRGIAQETLGGKPVIWESARTMKSFDLVGGYSYGWIARSVLAELRVIADVVGATYTLVYESDTLTVRFRSEAGDAISASPIVGRPNHVDGDWYNNVTIKLMTW